MNNSILSNIANNSNIYIKEKSEDESLLDCFRFYSIIKSTPTLSLSLLHKIPIEKTPFLPHIVLLKDNIFAFSQNNITI